MYLGYNCRLDHPLNQRDCRSLHQQIILVGVRDLKQNDLKFVDGGDPLTPLVSCSQRSDFGLALTFGVLQNLQDLVEVFLNWPRDLPSWCLADERPMVRLRPFPLVLCC